MPDIVCSIPRILSKSEARDIFKQAKKDLGPGLGDPAYLREAARRAGQDYTTFRRSWLGKAEDTGSVATQAEARILTGDEAAKVLSSTVKRELTEDELDALFTYTGMSYEKVNGMLRGTVTDFGDAQERYERVIRDLTQVTNLQSSPTEALLYRGVTDATAVFPTNMAGSTIADAGFLSTTTDLKTAENLYKDADSALVTLRIHKGQPLAPVDQLEVGPGKTPTHAGMENEFILPPGSRIRIISDAMLNGKRQIVGEVLLP